MECSKCHRIISDDTTVCPYCKKVLALECPNCHSKNDSSICENCGYIILTKCSKCGKTISTNAKKCKCGFSIEKSLAYQECETDEFASIIIKFSSLGRIRKLLASQELYQKFTYKLKNLLKANINKIDGNIINYNNTYVINFNKELSFATSTNRAIRLAIKIINAFTELNSNIIEEFGLPLNLNLTIFKKNSTDLLKKITYDTNVKLLTVKKEEKKYLKGMQVILDQYTHDCITKDYKTDSLYSIEKDGQQIMFYELILDTYVLPPCKKTDEEKIETKLTAINKDKDNDSELNGEYDFKVFDINAKCSFLKATQCSFFDTYKDNKIVAIRSTKELSIKTSEIVNYFLSKGLTPLVITCSEELNYRPWGVFEQIYREYYKLSIHPNLIPADFDPKHFKNIFNLIKSVPCKANTPEDARYSYMEDFENFLNILKNCVIIIEDAEFIDDSTLQALELYFDKFKHINTRFVFTIDSETSLHSKMPKLLRTSLYTEYIINKSSTDAIISEIKNDATDFLESFYFEKIKENFGGSKLFFDNAINYLREKNILIEFENKLIINSNASIVIPNNISGLIRERLKFLSKDMETSMILAYTSFLGPRLDLNVLSKLGLKNLENSIKNLVNKGFAFIREDILYINNYKLVKPVIEASLKKQANDFLAKNILNNIGTGLDTTKTLLLIGKLSMFKDEYLLLWKNSQYAMAVGDYDSYLKNCLGFLSLIQHIENNISEEDIENNKKEVYQNILLSLYSYSPNKIYDIENILLMDAIKEDDNDKIVKLSNLMLQGALISSNYNEALPLLHNILTRIPTPTLIVDGNINTRFLLLSLIHIEILFNIGEFTECIDIAKELLNIIRPEILDKIKPKSFSIQLFIDHLLETFRLVALSKVFTLDEDFEDFFNSIKISLNTDLPDKQSIIAIRDFLNGKTFATSNIETATSYSKIIYLILNEFENHSENYKTFAQNIYQAKILASEIKETQLELFCDLLIANSYANLGITKKAQIIYDDILEKANSSAIFNILTLTNYFIAKLKLEQAQTEEALNIINDTLALIQKYNNQAKITYTLFEKLFIKILREIDAAPETIEIEEQKLSIYTKDNQLSRILQTNTSRES